MDKPIGQVLIKVLFAEVTHSDTIDLGTEFSMLNLSKGGDSVQTSQVFGTPSPLTYQGGTTGFPTGLGVRTIEGDLDLTIHAFQETGRLNVLSRPYILTSNNQLATITIGEEVPIATGTTEVAGQSQTTIDYRDDIGIVLNVTPSINPDGLVNMTVNPRITTRSAESVAITETLSAEAFSTRSAETKVSVRDGHTIVIGGLIEDKLTDAIRKIPLLGDIPIVGHLFKRTIKEKTKTELLIFLTPHVAQDAAGLLGKDVPDRQAFAVLEGRSFDLVRGRCRSPMKALGKGQPAHRAAVGSRPSNASRASLRRSSSQKKSRAVMARAFAPSSAARSPSSEQACWANSAL